MMVDDPWSRVVSCLLFALPSAVPGPTQCRLSAAIHHQYWKYHMEAEKAHYISSANSDLAF